jgi:hypothetical protein
MTNKQELIDYLLLEGKGPMTWLDLANEFNLFLGETPKTRRRSTQDIWRRYCSKQFLEKKEIKEVKKDIKEGANSEYLEFLEWKNNKAVQIISKVKDQAVFNTVGHHLILGCWHVPFHNKQITNGILKMISNNDFVGFHLIGDFLDLNTLSSHDKGNFPVVKGLTIDQEYKEGSKVIDEFLAVLPKNIDKSFIYGNHEDRHNRYMANMQSAKTPISSPTDALQLREKGFNVHESWAQDKITLGKHLDLMHGTYYNQHCAKKHLDVLRGSVAFAHSHRIQSFIEGNTAGFNIGCGIDISSPVFNYAARATKSQWQNGFAVVYIDEKGDYYFNQIICHNNKFVYNGRIY